MKIAMLGLKGIPYPEGIENFTEQVSFRLAERGHQVTVYARPYVQVGEAYRGVAIKHLPSINTKHLDALTHTLLSSLDTLFKDFDIVHFHALGPSVFSLIPRIRGTKTIVHVHGLDWMRKKWGKIAKRMLRGGEYAAVYFPHRTMVISKFLRDYFKKKYNKEVDYVPTGVNLYNYRPPDRIRSLGLDKDSYVLFLGRLVPEKGCHYLIKALKELNTDLKLVIAGGSSHSDSYVSYLKQTNDSRVVFTGYVKGQLLEELFSNAYFYVLPSEIEGLPHSLLQALSFGKCVLASDIPQNKEALGECGVTFRSNDCTDLRDKMEFLIRNPSFVYSQCEIARNRVRENYSWDMVVDRIETIYRDCLSGRY